MGCIRRVNLDAIWSRGISAVKGNELWLVVNFKLLAHVGLLGACEYFCPLPYYDHCGYKTATQVVLLLSQSINYSDDHL